MVLQSFNNIFFPWNILHFLNREIMWKFKLLTSSVQCFSRLLGNYLKKMAINIFRFENILKKQFFRKMMFRINSIWLKSDFWSTPYFSLSQPSIWRNPATGHPCIVTLFWQMASTVSFLSCVVSDVIAWRNDVRHI